MKILFLSVIAGKEVINSSMADGEYSCIYILCVHKFATNYDVRKKGIGRRNKVVYEF